MAVSKTFMVLVVLCSLALYVAPSLQYGTIFANSVKPVKNPSTFFSGISTDDIHVNTADVGQIDAKNKDGFFVDTPGPITAHGSNINFLASVNMNFGDDSTLLTQIKSGDDITVLSNRFVFDSQEATITSNSVHLRSNSKGLLQGNTVTADVSNSLDVDAQDIAIQAALNANFEGSSISTTTTGDLALTSSVGSVAVSTDSTVRLNANNIDADAEAGVEVISFNGDVNFNSAELLTVQAAEVVSAHATGDVNANSAHGPVFFEASTTAALNGPTTKLIGHNSVILATDGDTDSKIEIQADSGSLKVTTAHRDVTFQSNHADVDFISARDTSLNADSANGGDIYFDDITDFVDIFGNNVNLQASQSLLIHSAFRQARVEAVGLLEETSRTVSFTAGHNLNLTAEETLSAQTTAVASSINIVAPEIRIQKTDPDYDGAITITSPSTTIAATNVEADAGRIRFEAASAISANGASASFITSAGDTIALSASNAGTFTAVGFEVHAVDTSVNANTAGISTSGKSVTVHNENEEPILLSAPQSQLTVAANSASVKGGNINLRGGSVAFDSPVLNKQISVTADFASEVTGTSLLQPTTTTITADSLSVPSSGVISITSSSGSQTWASSNSGDLVVTSSTITLSGNNVQTNGQTGLDFNANDVDDGFQFTAQKITFTAKSETHFNSNGKLSVTATGLTNIASPTFSSVSEDDTSISTTSFTMGGSGSTPDTRFITDAGFRLAASSTISFTSTGLFTAYAQDDDDSLIHFQTDSTNLDAGGGNVNIAAGSMYINVDREFKTTSKAATTFKTTNSDAAFTIDTGIDFTSTGTVLNFNAEAVSVESLYSGDLTLTSGGPININADISDATKQHFVNFTAHGNTVTGNTGIQVNAPAIYAELNGDLEQTATRDIINTITKQFTSYSVKDALFDGVTTQTITVTNGLNIFGDKSILFESEPSTGLLSSARDITWTSGSYTTINSATTLTSNVADNFDLRAGRTFSISGNNGVTLTSDATVVGEDISFVAADGKVNFYTGNNLNFISKSSANGFLESKSQGDTEFITASGATFTSQGNKLSADGLTDVGIYGHTTDVEGNIVFEAVSGLMRVSGKDLTYKNDVGSSYFTSRRSSVGFTATNDVSTTLTNGATIDSLSTGTFKAGNNFNIRGGPVDFHSETQFNWAVTGTAGVTPITLSATAGSIRFSTTAAGDFNLNSDLGQLFTITKNAQYTTGRAATFTAADSANTRFVAINGPLVMSTKGGPIIFDTSANSNGVGYNLHTNGPLNVAAGDDVHITASDITLNEQSKWNTYSRDGKVAFTGKDVSFTATGLLNILSTARRQVPRDGVSFTGSTVSLGTTAPAADGIITWNAENTVIVGSKTTPDVSFDCTGGASQPGFILTSAGNVHFGVGTTNTFTSDNFLIDADRLAIISSKDALSFTSTGATASSDNVLIQSQQGNVHFFGGDITETAARVSGEANTVKLSTETRLPAGILTVKAATGDLNVDVQAIDANSGAMVVTSSILWNGRAGLTLSTNTGAGGSISVTSQTGTGSITASSRTGINARTVGQDASLTFQTSGSTSPITLTTTQSNSPIAYTSAGAFRVTAGKDVTFSSVNAMAINAGVKSLLNGALGDASFTSPSVSITSQDFTDLSGTRRAVYTITNDLTSTSDTLLQSAGLDLSYTGGGTYSLVGVDLQVIASSGQNGSISYNSNLGSITYDFLASNTDLLWNVGGNFYGNAGTLFKVDGKGVDSGVDKFGFRLQTTKTDAGIILSSKLGHTEASQNYITWTAGTGSNGAKSSIAVSSVVGSVKATGGPLPTFASPNAALQFHTSDTVGDIDLVAKSGFVQLNAGSYISLNSLETAVPGEGVITLTATGVRNPFGWAMLFAGFGGNSGLSAGTTLKVDAYNRIVLHSFVTSNDVNILIGDSSNIGSLGGLGTGTTSSVTMKANGIQADINIATITTEFGTHVITPTNAVPSRLSSTRFYADGETGVFSFQSEKGVEILTLNGDQFYQSLADNGDVELRTTGEGSDIFIDADSIRFETNAQTIFRASNPAGSPLIFTSQIGVLVFEQQVQTDDGDTGIELRAHNGRLVANARIGGDVVSHAGRSMVVRGDESILFNGQNFYMEGGNSVMQAQGGQVDIDLSTLGITATTSISLRSLDDFYLTMEGSINNDASQVTSNNNNIQFSAFQDISFVTRGGDIAFNRQVDVSASHFLMPFENRYVIDPQFGCSLTSELVYNTVPGYSPKICVCNFAGQWACNTMSFFLDIMRLN